MRTSTTSGAVDLFVAEKLDVAAGIKPALAAFAALNPKFRVVEGSFMEIRQAIGVLKRSADAVLFLNEFIEEMIETGFVRPRLEASGQDPAAAVSR